jgi:NTE family protein
MAIGKPVPKKQRALVLQGGVALGAYEAGVINALCNEISAQTTSNDGKNQNVFDIVAGTSIGAINAAILVSGVVDRRKKLPPNTTLAQRWQYSAENLVRFWQNRLSSIPNLYNWWPYVRDPKLWVSTWEERRRLAGSGNNGDDTALVATGEAARRYFSAKEFFYAGAPHVFSSAGIQRDNRFLDNLYPPTNSWLRYNNTPLKESLKEFGDFPIATTFNNTSENREREKGFSNEPRLLTVAVDIADGVAVTFDSYSKKTTYNTYNSESKQYEERIIQLDRGLMPEHVIASASFPLYFDYLEIAGRKFWDGGLLSNTPLRELIHKHKTYWENYIGEQNLSKGMWNVEESDNTNIENAKVPDLEVYIINVWPSTENTVPSDYDGIKDRKNDIGHADKTEYDQKVAVLVSDYIELIREIRKIALDHITQPSKQKDFKEKLSKFLTDTKTESKPESKHRTGRPRKYEDLIKGRFKLSKVVTIERKDDRHSISNKWADFSSKTIEDLIEEGQNYEKTSIVKTI